MYSGGETQGEYMWRGDTGGVHVEGRHGEYMWRGDTGGVHVEGRHGEYMWRGDTGGVHVEGRHRGSTGACGGETYVRT